MCRYSKVDILKTKVILAFVELSSPTIMYYFIFWIDTDKQQAINLFLGTFKPDLKDTNIWDIPTDYYLHHSSTMNLKSFAFRQRYQN